MWLHCMPAQSSCIAKLIAVPRGNTNARYETSATLEFACQEPNAKPPSTEAHARTYDAHMMGLVVVQNVYQLLQHYVSAAV